MLLYSANEVRLNPLLETYSKGTVEANPEPSIEVSIKHVRFMLSAVTKPT